MKIIILILTIFTIVFSEKVHDSVWVSKYGELPSKSGWIVILNGSTDSVEAEQLYQKSLDDTNYYVDPAINLQYELMNETLKFPMFTKSDYFYGLNKGFWITISLITEHKIVAQKMVQYLHRVYGTGYMRPIKMFEIPDIRVLQIDTLKGITEYDEFHFTEMITVEFETLPKSKDSGFYFEETGHLCFYSYSKKLENSNVEIRGHSRASCSGSKSIPYNSSIHWHIPELVVKAGCWE